MNLLIISQTFKESTNKRFSVCQMKMRLFIKKTQNRLFKAKPEKSREFTKNNLYPTL